MKFQLTAFILTVILAPLVLAVKNRATWRKLLKDHADCVDLGFGDRPSRGKLPGGRSMPPQEQKLEALGTIIAEDGLTVLSLSRVDPTATLLSRIVPGGSVNANYTKFFFYAGWYGSTRQVVAQGHRRTWPTLTNQGKNNEHENELTLTPRSSKPMTLCL